MTEQDLKNVWKQQSTEDFAMNEAQLRAGASRFVRTIRFL